MVKLKVFGWIRVGKILQKLEGVASMAPRLSFSLNDRLSWGPQPI
jgi:hypothetical protein